MSVKRRPLYRLDVKRACKNLLVAGSVDLTLAPSSEISFLTEIRARTVIDFLKKRKPRRSPHQTTIRSAMIIPTINSSNNIVQVMGSSKEVLWGNYISRQLWRIFPRYDFKQLAKIHHKGQKSHSTIAGTSFSPYWSLRFQGSKAPVNEAWFLHEVEKEYSANLSWKTAWP